MHTISIEHSSDSSQRLDRFVKKYLPNAPLGAIYKMLRTGKIKVNGKRKPETYCIELGDEITFWMKQDELDLLTGASLPIVSPQIREPRKKIEVLYEDEYLMIVDKPPHMNVHPGDHKTQEASLIECILDSFNGVHDTLTFKPALVHRIDRDTSGCILIAKDKRTLEDLLELLQNHKIEKIYHTVVSPSPENLSGTFRDKLLRIENAKNEAKVRVDPAGQSAVTHYRVLQSAVLNLAGDKEARIPISLLECRIETGRTHQIRVHLSYHNCPIIGDNAYGDKKLNSFLERKLSINRQLLHARRLEFMHPRTKKRLIIEAPYPQDFGHIISAAQF